MVASLRMGCVLFTWLPHTGRPVCGAYPSEYSSGDGHFQPHLRGVLCPWDPHPLQPLESKPCSE